MEQGEVEIRQDYLWKTVPINKHRRLGPVHKGNVVTCSLLSACALHAILTGFHLKLWHRDSWEVILPSSRGTRIDISVRISKSGKFTCACCEKSRYYVSRWEPDLDVSHNQQRAICQSMHIYQGQSSWLHSGDVSCFL
jgi:hypothetical protein